NGIAPGLLPPNLVTNVTLPTDKRILVAKDLNTLLTAYEASLGCAVDFWKVDQQAFLGDRERELQRGYQRDLADLATRKSVVWCMAHSPVVWEEGFLQGLSEGGDRIIRTSDDYFQDVPASHAWHIHTNAQNSLLFTPGSPLITPDWDMVDPSSLPQLIARCLSSGPILLSGDISNFLSPAHPSLLFLDACQGRVGRVWAPGTASDLPVRVLSDVRGGRGCLVVEVGSTGLERYGDGRVRAGPGGGSTILGLFNVAERSTRVGDRISPSDWGGPLSERWAVWMFFAERFEVVHVKGDVAVEVGMGGVEVVTVCPLVEIGRWFVGCVGVLDRYVGAAAVSFLEIGLVDEGREIVEMVVGLKTRGGRVGIVVSLCGVERDDDGRMVWVCVRDEVAGVVFGAVARGDVRDHFLEVEVEGKRVEVAMG
ncbi:protein kinase complex component, partial [Dinochytrium kinnereticum]